MNSPVSFWPLFRVAALLFAGLLPARADDDAWLQDLRFLARELAAR